MTTDLRPGGEVLVAAPNDYTLELTFGADYTMTGTWVVYLAADPDDAEADWIAEPDFDIVGKVLTVSITQAQMVALGVRLRWLTITQNGERVLVFGLRVSDRPGRATSASLTVTAPLTGEVAVSTFAPGGMGAQGAQGAVGAQGDEGTGAQGALGAQGTTGAQGNAGSNGAQGAIGAQGSAGAQGSTGAQGSAGSNGSQGAQGSTGTTGSQGAQGAGGSAGAQGAQGTAGSTGSQGAQGGSGVVAATAPVDYDSGTKTVSLDTGTGSDQVPQNSDLRQVKDGRGTTANTSVAGELPIDLNVDGPTMDSLQLATGAKIIGVRLCTVAALPTCTYNNASLGVGATLTASANAALADIDFVTPALNDLIAVNNQAAPEQNGIYKVTQLGDGSHPFILTRVLAADTVADFAGGVVIHVSEGRVFGGALLRMGSVPTMGTSPIRFRGPARPQPTPSDVILGGQRNGYRYFADFEEMTADITTTASKIPGRPEYVSLNGTAAKAAVGTDGQRGSIDLQTGTTSTGFCTVANSVAATAFNTARPAYFSSRSKIVTVATSAENFVAIVGLSDSLTTVPGSGLFFRAGAFSGTLPNWFAVCRNGGVETSSAIDTSIAPVAGGYRQFTIIYDEQTLTAYFFIGSAQVAAIVNTNLPSGVALASVGGIFKTNGTTSRSFFHDRITADAQDATSIPVLQP